MVILNYLAGDKQKKHLVLELKIEGARLSEPSLGFECGRPGFESPTRTTE